MSVAAILAGAAAGLASAPHCAAMCGPLAGCASAERPLAGGAQYHVSRLAAYAVAGALAGWGSRFVQELLLGRAAGAVFSWSVALALALLAHRLWRRPEASRAERLVTLRRPGEGGLRERAASLADRLWAHLPKHPAALGAMTALLPCGALYAALALAAGAGDPLYGALSMVAFGAVSALGLVAVGAVAAPARRLLSRPLVARGLATVCLVAAFVFAVRPITAITEGPAESCHAP